MKMFPETGTERKGMTMKLTWMVTCERYGFRYTIFVNATEDRLRKYMESELPEAVSYTGATDKEVEAARLLKLPVYLY